MLSKDILENIKTLLAVTSSINETYAKLKELEIKGEKESQEYQSLVEGLKSSLALEKSIYDRFPNNLDILGTIERTISDKKESLINFNLQEKIDAIVNNHNLIKTRIHLNLFNKMLAIKDADFVINVNDKEVLKNQTSRSILIINNTVIKDFVNTILTILNLYLNNPKYHMINDLLLNFKYSLSFLYKDVEDDFLENDFNINNELYWESNAIADYYKLDREKLNSIQRGSAYQVFHTTIDEIIEISLDEKSSRLEIFAYTISEVLVRACLLLLGDNVVAYLKGKRLRLDPNTDQIENAKDILKAAQKRVDNVFAMYDKDKELLNVISLRVL